MHCPNSPFAQLNHCLVQIAWLKELMLSWISPSPSVVLTISFRAVVISWSSLEVNIRMILAMGQAWPSPAWGPPTLEWVSLIRRETKRNVRIDDWAAHEIWVIFAEDEFARGLVDGVADVQVTKERSTQQTGDVGVVHEIAYVRLVYSYQFVWNCNSRDPKPSTS